MDNGFHIKLAAKPEQIRSQNIRKKEHHESINFTLHYIYHFTGKSRNLQALAILLGLKDSAEEDDTKNKIEQHKP